VLEFDPPIVGVVSAGDQDPPVHGTPIPAGRTLVIRCQTNLPFRVAKLYWRKKQVPFYPIQDNQWRAHLGIPVEHAPGLEKIKFYAETTRGRIFQEEVEFRILKSTAPTTHVRLPKDKDKLLSSGQVRRDSDKIDAVLKSTSSIRQRWQGLFVLPATGRVSSDFGERRRYGRLPGYRAHQGMDIANKTDTPVGAPNNGVVLFSGWLKSFGFTVILDHGHGICTYYEHLRKTFVNKGDVVETGQKLGLMGAGGLATGPHLHWSLTVHGVRVDPKEWTGKGFE